MSRETETVTEEVEREREHWICDGPGDDGDGCGATWDDQREFGLNAHVIIADPWVPVEETTHKMPVAQPPTKEGYFVSSEDPYARPQYYHNEDEGVVNADGEIHLCDDCYEKIKPIFGMDGFFGQHDKEEDDEEEHIPAKAVQQEAGLDDKLDLEDQNSLWERIVNKFT